MPCNIAMQSKKPNDEVSAHRTHINAFYIAFEYQKQEEIPNSAPVILPVATVQIKPTQRQNIWHHAAYTRVHFPKNYHMVKILCSWICIWFSIATSNPSLLNKKMITYILDFCRTQNDPKYT